MPNEPIGKLLHDFTENLKKVHRSFLRGKKCIASAQREFFRQMSAWLSLWKAREEDLMAELRAIGGYQKFLDDHFLPAASLFGITPFDVLSAIEHGMTEEKYMAGKMKEILALAAAAERAKKAARPQPSEVPSAPSPSLPPEEIVKLERERSSRMAEELRQVKGENREYRQRVEFLERRVKQLESTIRQFTRDAKKAQELLAV